MKRLNEWTFKRHIMREYDAAAHLYDLRYAEEQTAKYKAALEGISIKKHDIVLDVGCGTGLLFNHIASKAEILIGLDISRKTLLRANQRAKNSTNVQLILADADYLPLKNSVFDHVFAVTVIQNAPKPEKTLNEIKRVAKKDAVVVVSGLKKKFSSEAFAELLRKLSLNLVEMKNGNLKCYVAVCSNKTP